MAPADKDHRKPVLVGGRNHLAIANGPSGLGDRRSARPGHGIEPVTEREEGV